MKALYTTLLLLPVAFSACAQLQLTETIHFGTGLKLPNPCTDRALIVTPNFLFASDGDCAYEEGYVYIFTNSVAGWRFSQKLNDQIYPNPKSPPPGQPSNGWFGYALGYGTNGYGEWLAVNSTWSFCTNASTQPGHTYGKGDIQMFKLNPSNQQWEFFQYIHPPIADEFGNSPSISGDWMVCGELGHFYNSNTNYAYSGAAYFYQFDGASWVLRQGPILCGNGTNNWNFGYTTAINGTNAFIYGRYNNQYMGGVYLYELRNGTWVETGVLRPNSPKPAETFGVAYIQCRAYGDPGIKDDLLVVSAPMRSSTVYTGGVYFFQHNGIEWQQIGSYFPTDLQPKTYFGNSGDMQGDLCVIGSRFADWTQTYPNPTTTDGKGRGYVFRFNGTTWNLEEILAPDVRQGDWFGSWPATDGTNVFVVSPGAYVNGVKTIKLDHFAPAVPQEPAPATFKVTSIQKQVEGLFLQWSDVSNRLYTVERNADATTTNWVPESSVIWPISTNQVLLPYPTESAVFFRVKAE